MKKYALSNSYFKNRKENDPDTIIEVVSFFKEKGELPFRYNGDNWVYDAMTERQKKKGVKLGQFLTPDKTAERLAELAAMYKPSNGAVLDACCGTGQLTARLIKNGFTVEGFDIDSEMVEICNMLYPDCTFRLMDFHEAGNGTEYELIVANPPYETKELQCFMGWLYENMSGSGKAVLLLPSGFIEKQRPKALTEVLSKFNCIRREAMNESFERTKTTAEIVIIELKEQKMRTQVTNPSIENVGQLQTKAENGLQEVKTEESVIPAVLPEPSDLVQQIDLSYVSLNPFNPRRFHSEEELDELAGSIRNHGVIQPITVRLKEGGYEIVCGERRFRSSLIAGKDTIPAIIKNYTDDEAMEITIIENLHRTDISPVEEAISFGRLIELRKYTIEDLVKQFGKSDNYIRGRLQLRNLIDDAAILLAKGEISIGIALELSKYNHGIQQDVYAEHLGEDSYYSWKNLTVKDFTGRIENSYTTDLGQYSFDRTECISCPFNSATFDLFSDGKCGKCQNTVCLKAKQKEFMLSSTLEIIDKDKKVDVYVSPCANSAAVVENLKELGYDVTSEINPQKYPEKPELPERKDFEDEKDFDEALIEYDADMTVYMETVEEIEHLAEEGNIVKMVDVSNHVPVLCYRRVSEPEKGKKEVNPVAKLRSRDKRNKEISIEKTVEDVKRFIKNRTAPDSEFTGFEEDLLYFVMMKYLSRSHHKIFGFKDSYAGDDEKANILSKLTDEQKNLIRRDFIISHLSETFGDCKQSELLLQFCRLHFPAETSEIQTKYDAVYQKRHERIIERINEYEKVAKQMNQASSNESPKSVETSSAAHKEDETAVVSAAYAEIQEEDESVVGTTENTVESQVETVSSPIPNEGNFGPVCDDIEKYAGDIEPASITELEDVA